MPGRNKLTSTTRTLICMQTDNLKKKRVGNESFWLVGQPDVEFQQIRKGENTGKWQVEVRGFDYFNAKIGELESGDEDRIAGWMPDTDRSQNRGRPRP